MISYIYSSIDGIRRQMEFKTLADAQEYAHKMIGEHPERSTNYAVSDDGIGVIRDLKGTTWVELFPPA